MTDRQFAKIIRKRPSSVYYEVTENFQRYASGIYQGDEECSQSTNHAVLAVGYNIDASADNSYFIIKNSWDSAWGEEGYIRLGMTEGNKKCGMNLITFYVK